MVANNQRDVPRTAHPPGLPMGTDALDERACWDLLRQGTVGRLAVVVDGEPDIFPVNYVVDHGTIVFRTDAGRKLSAAARRPVAFEVEGVDAGQGIAWSVVVHGVGSEIRDMDEVIEAMDLPLRPLQAGGKARYVRITASAVTGRRIRVEGSGPAPS